jgi:class 3 adenylate cyclase
MMCPRCGVIVANNRKFCGDCGTPLPWQCSACGSDNPADKRFCGDCGVALEATHKTSPVNAAVPSAERRLLTVMFIDLVESTPIGQRLDPEDFRQVIAAFNGVVTGLVTQYEGFVARYTGDGALVYFGYPQAHEVDAERAIRAGLSIVEAVACLNTAAGPPGTLRVRIGIDTGFVVVGDLIGSGSSLETAVVGDTPNLAARLQTAAEPGTVVISDATRLLVGGLFECRELVLPNLKGRQNVERASAVLGESLIDNRYDALRRGQSSLVGRTEELELLLRRWEQSKAGEGRVVLLTGEPGIGKSHLIAALEQSLGTGRKLLRFLCSPHHLSTPLYPLIRQIERAAGFQRGDSPSAKWDKLTNALLPSASPEDQALLADLLSIAGEARDTLDSVTPQRRKVMTFAAILRQLDILVCENPLLIIVEDIHWADPSTLELLDRMVETVQQLRVLLVITARPGVHPAWATRPHATVQLLSGLNRRSAVALVKQVAGERELPADVSDRIIAHADSVPLYIEELTKTVIKRLEDNEQREHAPMWSPSADLVPTSLYSSLMARLDRSSVGKEIAQIGAVVGREFSFDIAQALSGLPAKQLESALDDLVHAEIIVMHDRPPFATYTFTHALVHDAAYASLLRDRRRAIHLRLAQEMEKDAAGAATEPDLIAWHYAEAGVPSSAIHHYQKAAEYATGHSALAEKVNHLQNALRQIAHLPESPERNRGELALQLALGRALIDHAGGDSEAVRVTFERARELCLALNEINLLPRVFDGLVLNYHFIHSELEKIAHYATEMAALQRRTGDLHALLMIKRAESQANLLRGRFEPAREEMQNIIDMYDVERDGPHAGMTTRDSKVSICTLLGICLTILGDADSGAAVSLTGVRHAESLNHPISLNLGLRRACVQGMLQKDARRVIEFSSQLAALSAEYETYKGSWEGTFFHDWAQLCTQSDPVLFGRIHTFLHRLDVTKNWALLPFYMASAAELSGQYGDTASAAALLERAAELVAITGARWCEAEIMRLQARFSARDSTEAAALLDASLAQARQQGAKLWELRTAIQLAEVLRDQGNRTAARDVLKLVFAWFSEGRSTPDYATARTLLAELDLCTH